jgi:hypothetical protein
VLINVKSSFVRFTVVAVEKQFVLTNLSDCLLACYAACKDQAPYYILICGLPHSAGSFTIFQIGIFPKKLSK